ncbi:hypothetical protein NO559_11695 [Dasania sp. GY-MA-18]|uniref:Uncharacterized protein n=1 Tax=Dasania phycosphaerae TaxID=2950436 RepID=A0A9J6RNF0_9GAMM|nr:MULTISPECIES: hypothetical protein [Dasania]MCR8923441.1 hypothetical protein [Dasania sp. GY-MA-18]MCZ0865874.1 hypothetical protein [Dasania phycosphaerae]MCZ0869598.1 hypothetical protein [Dasania phycosphaerae]
MTKCYRKELLYLYEKDCIEQALRLTSAYCLVASLLILLWACHPVAYQPLAELSTADLYRSIMQGFSYHEQPLGFRVLVVGLGAYVLKALLASFANKSLNPARP